MEIYTLDPLLRRTNVIDRFESLIWTERFSAFGDFELVIRSTPENRALLKPGTQLAMNESYRVMTVEVVLDNTTAEGKDVLKISGNSLESVLLDRAAIAPLGTTPSMPIWHLEDPPSDIMRTVFHDICVAGVIDPLDVIPFVVEGSIMPTSTLDEPIDPIILDLEPASVYDVIKNIAEVWSLGFRLLRNFDMGQLYWDVYAGSDRTSGQTVRPPVIFAPELDNLQNTTELNSIEGSKNVAYVYCPDGFLEVYPIDVPLDTDGFDRRILIVKAEDITSESVADVPAALAQRGLEELAKTRPFQAFDGEISQKSQYKYQRDYYLGDIVEMRNNDGVMNKMRVTEQIFTSDREGDKSYPTLAVNQFVNTGSWLSWLANQTWLDLDDDDTTWAEQP